MNIELLQSLSVLYAEDEASLREEVVESIRPFLKNVLSAQNGQEALDIFVQDPEAIDIIVTDIMMPKKDGISFVDDVRGIDKEIPIIYTTAFSDSEYLQRTINQSVSGYIVKPIDIEALLAAIEKASVFVENKRLRRKLEEINKEQERIIEEKTKEIELKNKALIEQIHTDDLTGLANRRSLLEDLEHSSSALVALVDIDSFRTINELYGEESGNTILKEFAKLLSKSIPECKHYRIGGDVFAYMKENVGEDIALCKENVEKLIQKCSQAHFCIPSYNIDIQIDITVGLSYGNEQILQKASMALKKAKEMNERYLFYKEEYNFNKCYENDIRWGKIIKNALAQDGIEVYFQPVVDADKNVVKYESLVRIEEGESVYSPFEFLEISKKLKLYPKITKIVIEKTLKKLRTLNKKVGFNINLSIQDMENDEIVAFIESKLFEYAKLARYVTFEILESENIQNYDKILGFIEKIKKFDAKIAIDDFGSGYSNFEYLLKIAPDYIKIDGSLVKNIDNDKNARAIVKTINSFAKSLGAQTVAEFVHSEEIAQLLQQMGVDYFQGYLFGKPSKEIQDA